ncbi:MAG: hypothetical protein R3Y43_05680 [Alphaproteobacteria bacterium]
MFHLTNIVSCLSIVVCIVLTLCFCKSQKRAEKYKKHYDEERLKKQLCIKFIDTKNLTNRFVKENELSILSIKEKNNITLTLSERLEAHNSLLREIKEFRRFR